MAERAEFEKVTVPVAAQYRFRHPQKSLPDWSIWQPATISLDRPSWEIDSQGYEVEYRLLYDAPQSAEQQPEPYNGVSEGWIKQNRQKLLTTLDNLHYAGFNLCAEFDFSRIQGSGRRTIESTCPEKSLLIAIRDLSEMIGEPLPEPPL